MAAAGILESQKELSSSWDGWPWPQ